MTPTLSVKASEEPYRHLGAGGDCIDESVPTDLPSLVQLDRVHHGDSPLKDKVDRGLVFEHLSQTSGRRRGAFAAARAVVHPRAVLGAYWSKTLQDGLISAIKPFGRELRLSKVLSVILVPVSQAARNCNNCGSSLAP